MRIAAFFLLAALLPAQKLTIFETHLASGKAAMQQSRYSEADRQLRAAIEDARLLDPADPASAVHAADALETLCDLDLLIGKYDEAVSLEEQAIAGLEQSIGVDNHDLAPHLIRLSGAYRADSQTLKAEPVLQRVLALDIKALGPDDARVATDYDNLGSADVELRNLGAARTAYEKALAARVARLGDDHIDVANAYVNLGVVEEKDDKTKAARGYYEKALAISEKKLGDESYSLTGILDRLGLLLRKVKDLNEAERVLARSLAIREKTLGARHSDVAPALDNLALTYFLDSKYAEAEPLFIRSMQIWLATQGQYSPFYAQSLDNLGALYSAQQKYDEAEPYFKKALSIRELSDMESLYNLALIYQARNDAKSADLYYQRAILLGDKGLGSEHPEVVPVLEAYKIFLGAVGRTADQKKIAARIHELTDRKDAEPSTSGGRKGEK